MSKACEEHREMLQKEVDRLRTRKKGHQDLVENLRNVECKVIDNGQQQRDTINRQLAQLKDLIESKRQQLLQQSSLEEDQKLNQIRTQIEKTRGTLEQVDNLLSRTEKMLRLDSDYSFLTVVLPLVQDAMRCSSQVVEPMTQVQTSFRPLSVEWQIKALGDLDLSVQVGGSRLPAAIATIGSTSTGPYASLNKVALAPGQLSPAMETQTKARVLNVSATGSAPLPKTGYESAAQAQVMRVYRAGAPSDIMPRSRIGVNDV
jgi:hypothetical protein